MGRNRSQRDPAQDRAADPAPTPIGTPVHKTSGQGSLWKRYALVAPLCVTTILTVLVSLALILALSFQTVDVVKIFTSLTTGLGTLVDRMVAMLPANSIHLRCPVQRLERQQGRWRLSTTTATDSFDEVVLATPSHITRALLPERLEHEKRRSLPSPLYERERRLLVRDDCLPGNFASHRTWWSLTLTICY